MFYLTASDLHETSNRDISEASCSQVLKADSSQLTQVTWTYKVMEGPRACSSYLHLRKKQVTLVGKSGLKTLIMPWVYRHHIVSNTDNVTEAQKTGYAYEIPKFTLLIINLLLNLDALYHLLIYLHSYLKKVLFP